MQIDACHSSHASERGQIRTVYQGLVFEIVEGHLRQLRAGGAGLNCHVSIAVSVGAPRTNSEQQYHKTRRLRRRIEPLKQPQKTYGICKSQ